MELLTGVHRATPIEAEEVRRRAAEIGAPIYLLSTLGASSRADLFNRVRESLPLDPPVVGNTVIDALSDSLWGGLYSAGRETVVVIWEGSSDLAKNAPKEFEITLEMFRDIASTVAQPKYTGGQPKSVCVYLV